MRLPARRASFEAMLRVLSVVAMATLAVRFWIGATPVQPEARATSASLDSALVSWSLESPRSVTVRASLVPDAAQRDWLVAIRRNGSRVSWSVEDSSAGAVVMESGPLPDALARLAMVGKPHSIVKLADGLGRIDSLRLGSGGSASRRLRALGVVQASLGAATASSTARDSLLVKPVLVIGPAGWEAKFVAAALEEDGWSVNTRLQVAPGAVVRQGSTIAIDTGAYGTIVVLDSVSPLQAENIQRFVNEGGGLAASGPGIRHPALFSILPRQLRAAPGAMGGLFGAIPRAGLNARVLVFTPNNVVFERRQGDPVVVAERLGSGRIVAAGYDDTWRLRMVPPDENAPRLHRQWWSSLVGSVALTRIVGNAPVAVDEAPFAATVASLGPPLVPADLPPDELPFPWEKLLASIAGGALLAEWLSRRLRGVA